MAENLHEITIAASAERIFDAITTHQGMISWWTADCEVEPKVGSIAVFRFNQRSIVFKMRIDELARSRRVAWACLGDIEQWTGTQISFYLEPLDSIRTRVKFVHGNWRSTDGHFPTSNTTWGALMVKLRDYCEGRGTGPFFTGRTD